MLRSTTSTTTPYRSAYPNGPREAEVPDLVRLVTTCDIYGALIERRPYRAPMSGGEVYAFLQSMSDRLDTDLVEAFRPVMTTFDPVASASAKARNLSS